MHIVHKDVLIQLVVGGHIGVCMLGRTVALVLTLVLVSAALCKAGYPNTGHSPPNSFRAAAAAVPGPVFDLSRAKMANFVEALAEAEALNAEANSLFGTQRYDEALSQYSSAIERVELHAQRLKAAEAPLCKYLCNRAAAYLGAGYHNEAKKDCNVALSMDPLLDKAMLRRALACEALGKHRCIYLYIYIYIYSYIYVYVYIHVYIHM